MSICKGIAGRRGKNPIGIFMHNGADGPNATTEYYKTIYREQTWKMGLHIIMFVVMEFCRQRMIQTALGIAAT